MTLDDKFNKFIESGILDDNEFQEYEICITEFDNMEGREMKGMLFTSEGIWQPIHFAEKNTDFLSAKYGDRFVPLLDGEK